MAQTQHMDPVDQARWQRMHGLDFLPDEDLYNEENGSLSALFCSWLFLLTPAQMKELNRHPVWFSLPLCKFTLMSFARKLEGVEDIIRACVCGFDFLKLVHCKRRSLTLCYRKSSS